MSDFATVQDVIDLQRPLTQEEQARVTKIIPLICDTLRVMGRDIGLDMDAKIAADPAYASVCKLVTTDIVIRAIRVSTEGEPMAQESQAALGYSWSGTSAVAGGGIANSIMNNDKKRLGLLKQRAGMIKLYETTRN
ncbi:MAG: phage Gp19/Gp15/Gp42 family protein [Bacilli bacterium]|nr:phage Gp19/Gp15/Gp42 family protein [Bacilli bacterium]